MVRTDCIQWEQKAWRVCCDDRSKRDGGQNLLTFPPVRQVRTGEVQPRTSRLLCSFSFVFRLCETEDLLPPGVIQHTENSTNVELKLAKLSEGKSSEVS